MINLLFLYKCTAIKPAWNNVKQCQWSIQAWNNVSDQYKPKPIFQDCPSCSRFSNNPGSSHRCRHIPSYKPRLTVWVTMFWSLHVISCQHYRPSLSPWTPRFLLSAVRLWVRFIKLDLKFTNYLLNCLGRQKTTCYKFTANVNGLGIFQYFIRKLWIYYLPHQIVKRDQIKLDETL